MKVLVDWQLLESATLQSMLSEIVSRDGTDYGLVEKTLDEKIAGARRALESGIAVLAWDTGLESARLMPVEECSTEELQHWNIEK